MPLMYGLTWSMVPAMFELPSFGTGLGSILSVFFPFPFHLCPHSYFTSVPIPISSTLVALSRCWGLLQLCFINCFMFGLDYGDPSYLLPSPLPLSQTLEVVAIKQISLKSAPDHLSSIRQKEIEILKVLYSLTVYLPCTSEVTFFLLSRRKWSTPMWSSCWTITWVTPPGHVTCDVILVSHDLWCHTCTIVLTSSTAGREVSHLPGHGGILDLIFLFHVSLSSFSLSLALSELPLSLPPSLTLSPITSTAMEVTWETICRPNTHSARTQSATSPTTLVSSIL